MGCYVGTSLIPRDIALIPLLLGLTLISPPLVRTGCMKLKEEVEHALTLLEHGHFIINVACDISLPRQVYAAAPFSPNMIAVRRKGSRGQ